MLTHFVLRALPLSALLLTLSGCSSDWLAVDADGDGVPFGLDCDDLNDQVGDKEEIWYDGIDQNCDGNDADMDGDGFVPAFYVADFPDAWQDFPAHVASGDCWDSTLDIPTGQLAVPGAVQPSAELVFPGAEDSWYDGVDQDCGGNSDFDQDGDGVDSAQALKHDGTPAGEDCADALEDVDALRSEDCDAGDPVDVAPELIFPGANDPFYDGLDQNCDGANDFDQDGDGFAVCEECNDKEASIFPTGLPEAVWYDGVDDNCDGNDGDRDGDGYVDAAYIAKFPDDWDKPEFTAHLHVVRDSDGDVVPGIQAVDCWDDPTQSPVEFLPLGGYAPLNPEEVYPRAKTDTPVDVVYDGIDADCWGDTDFDGDQDGHDSSSVQQRDSSVGDDCDDTDAAIYPGTGPGGLEADEYCDGVDSDCDGSLNDTESLDCVAYYYDGDADGYGAGTGFVCQCAGDESTGYTSLLNTDCEDADADEYPGAPDLCDGRDNDCDGSLETAESDADSDGYVECVEDSAGWEGGSVTGFGDCDDSDATVYPAASELCDGQDNDCDGSPGSDEADGDGDGYVECAKAGAIWVGASITGYNDCDDTEPTVYPSATETVADGIDQDCDNADDCYVDLDKDGYGDPSSTDTSIDLDCSRKYLQLSDNADDCDDTDDTVYTGASELCDGQDNACAGSVGSDEIDYDGDGYVECSDDGSTWAASSIIGYDDCDDSVASVYPNAAEIVADGTDQDCDGVDTCYQDSDGDSYGSTTELDGPDLDCDQPGSGVANDNTDCLDSDAVVYPSAPELCDGQENSCAGAGTPTDETDPDNDGYVECADDGSVWVGGTIAGYEDCDESDADRNPGEREVCDAADKDEDCDGLSDDDDSSVKASTKTDWYDDADGDGYGDLATTATQCDAPTGYITDSSDCDDTDALIFPGATEGVADGVDQDCDDEELCYVDGDGDGYGDDSGLTVASTTDLLCLAADGEADDVLDCDDSTSSVNPGQTEVCDAADVDEDCSGASDDADAGVDTSTMTTWYADGDGDGFGDYADTGTDYCDAPSTEVNDNTDCDDTDPSINPDATDIPQDGVDQDCDGSDAPYTLADLAAGDILISELMVNPSVPLDKKGEYIEIYNNSGGEVDFDGLYVEDEGGDSVTVSGGPYIVVDGGYFMLAASGNSGVNGGFTPDATWDWTTEIRLENSGGVVSLYESSGGTLLDEVDFRDLNYFPDSTSGNPADGATMSLDPLYYDSSANDHGPHWCVAVTVHSGNADLGTPGASNDGCSFSYSFATDIEPVLTSVCGGCHGGSNINGGMDYIEEWSTTVFQPSTQDAPYYRVDPFTTTNSYLWQKLVGTASTGGMMPATGSLTTAEKTMIEDWINEGAPQ